MSYDSWKLRAPEDDRDPCEDDRPDFDPAYDGECAWCGDVRVLARLTDTPDGPLCPTCLLERDTDDEPSQTCGGPVQCSYPGCNRMTYIDVTYGDLCSVHIRAPNE